MSKVNKFAFSPDLEGWSPPTLLEDVNTGAIHAAVSRVPPTPWCTLSELHPSAFNPDWKGRLHDLCRDCFDVYTQESLL